MKILYILDQNIDSGKTSGIIHKVRDQISLWGASGLEVEVLSLYSFQLYDSEMSEVLPNNYRFHLAPHGRFYTLIRLIYSTLLLARFLKNKKYDLIYIRQRPYMPFLRKALSRFKVIIELNSDDVGEYREISIFMYLYNLMTRNLFYSVANGFVAVTEELKQKFGKFSKQSIVIGNSINTKSYPWIQSKENQKLKFCFIGSPGFSWHGIEKIIYLAKKLPDYHFEIIGFSGKDTENLKFHGYVDLIKAKELVSRCDIGICTLSLHKKGMKDACPLKSRQYLAQGLPIIYAYNDPDLTGTEEFVLKINNNESNVADNIQAIKKFANFIWLKRDIRKEVREFAEKKLDVKIKENLRIQFFNKVFEL